jgi:hypothetical protein
MSFQISNFQSDLPPPFPPTGESYDDLEGIFESTPPPQGERRRRFESRRVSILRIERGNRCEYCGKRGRTNKRGRPNLEFAHLAPTGLRGRGRGQIQRYYDIKRHPETYALLCRGCHRST